MMFQRIETLSDLFLYKIRMINLELNRYVLYKIIDAHVAAGKKHLQVQCVHTNAVVSCTLHEIIYDIQILHGLHPLQGCFVGIEYGKSLRSLKEFSHQKPLKNHFIQGSFWRYGTNNLLYQDRYGLVAFESIREMDREVLLMDPRDIALSEEIITQFDASQAFFIGIFAGLKLANQQKVHRKTRSHLKLVKGLEP